MSNQSKDLRPVRVKPYRGNPERFGFFHAWGQYADNSDGAAPVAIVELNNGEIITPDPTDIVFTDRHRPAAA